MGTFKDFITGIVGVINSFIVPTILALIFLAFIWGVAKYFFIGGTEEASRQKGRQLVLWGIIGIIALVSLWGIVNILLSTLGIQQPG